MSSRAAAWASGAPVRLVVGLLCAAASADFARAETEPTVADALAHGEFAVGLRYRFELVNEKDAALEEETGLASTLRTVMSYRSGRFRGFGVYGEFENVADLGLGDKHDNRGAGALSNGVDDHPAIADPEITEINQIYLGYAGIEATNVEGGRMAISLDDERFVGPVGWRQNQQSFDAVRIVQESIPRTTVTYAYLHGIHRIFGDHKPVRGHLINAMVDLGGAGTLVPFLYSLDYVKDQDADGSRLSAGASWTTQLALGETLVFPIHLQAATQRDVGDNPTDVQASYGRAELGLQGSWGSAKLGAEVLGGNPSDGAFATPLATLHKFNGWADKFLTTPSTGLQDYFISVATDWNDIGATLVAHSFRASSTSANYGSEIDAQLLYETKWRQSFGAKSALYMADEFSFDTTKLMLFTSYGF